MERASQLVRHRPSGSGVFLRVRRPLSKGDLQLSSDAAQALITVVQRKPRMSRVVFLWEACIDQRCAEEMLELVGAEAMRPEAAVEIVNQVAQALAQTKVWWKDLDKQPGVPVVSRDHMANRLWRQAMHIVRGKGKAVATRSYAEDGKAKKHPACQQAVLQRPHRRHAMSSTAVTLA
uniref:Uncharacterized protein n=1 Tax=Calcidiscus leptoporus TaxID=127549 RepID=A0A7S0J7L0_9EUKA|mmetsp:Transcript_41863/g.98077  ORF Transcript_41863/g.98077 Transcript_41863/m.98077 type:complete len:177 (+) Transcript_41863:30-560(+)